MKIGLRKIIFLVSRDFFTRILISKMGLKMNLRIITKSHEPDPKIGFLTKSISKPYSRATAMPPAWELSALLFKFRKEQNFNKRSFSSSWKIRRNFLFLSLLEMFLNREMILGWKWLKIFAA